MISASVALLRLTAAPGSSTLLPTRHVRRTENGVENGVRVHF